MAQQADGTVYINSSIDTKGVKVGSKEIEAATRRAAKTVSEIGNNAKDSVKALNSSFSEMGDSISKQEQKVEQLKKELAEISQQKVATDELKELQKDLSSAEKKIDSLYGKLRELEHEGKEGTAPYQRTLQQLDIYKEKVNSLRRDIDELNASGGAYQLSDTSKVEQKLSSEITKLEELKKKEAEAAAESARLREIGENAQISDQYIVDLSNELDALKERQADLAKAGLGLGYEEFDQNTIRISEINQELKQYKTTLAETAMQEQNATQTTGLLQSVLNVLAKAAHAPISALQLLGNAIKQLPHATLNLVANGLHKIADAAKNAAKKIGRGLVSGLKKAGAAMLSFHKNTQKSNGSLGNGIKTILKYGFGIRSLYALFNKVRSAIKEGFSNLYAESDKFKNSVDNLKASLTTLKNALATAFAPIVQFAIPYIQKLVEWVTRAADAMGQLMAALLGQKTYTKAIKQTTAALKEETKASNKQLSSLDKLNNLTSESADNADTGAGGMFEEVPISDKWKNIANWLKDMWENSDFYELGKMLGEKLKSILDNIPWEEIKEKARKLGKSLASLINGFIEVEGLGYSIGRTLAEALNTAFEFLNAFVHELHWESVGKFIADSINGFLQNIDWDLIYDTFVTLAQGLSDAINSFNEWLDWDSIATTISNFFNTLIDTLYTFIAETDWTSIAENLGKTASDAFIGIDWAKAGQTVGEALKEFFNFIATAIENVDWWAVGEKVKEFLINIDWNSVADAFFETIGAIWGAFGAFLGGLIVDGIDSAKEYFQGKIEEAGGDIVSGILLGIRDGLANIAEWLLKHVYEPFMEGFCKAFGIASPSKVMAEMGGYIVSGLLNGLKEKWSAVTDWIQEKIKWLTDKIQSLVKSVSDKLSGIKGKISGAFSNLTSKFTYNISVPNIQTPVVSVPTIATANIPYLATGAVIPPNAPFAAILGDQKNGNNLELPESLLRKIVREESGNNDNGDINLNLTVECEGYQLLNIMQKLDRQFYKQNGRHAFS